jgi:uncharacterized protein
VGSQARVTTIRVVLDTNVVLSALLFAHGRLRWLREAWQQGQIVPLVNRTTITELLRVLAYPKFRLSQSDREDVLAEYLPFCETFTSYAVVNAPTVKDDADRYFLQLALTAKVAFLVTGDNDLLVPASTLPSDTLRIVTPEQFRSQLSQHTPGAR